MLPNSLEVNAVCSFTDPLYHMQFMNSLNDALQGLCNQQRLDLIFIHNKSVAFFFSVTIIVNEMLTVKLSHVYITLFFSIGMYYLQ